MVLWCIVPPFKMMNLARTAARNLPIRVFSTGTSMQGPTVAVVSVL